MRGELGRPGRGLSKSGNIADNDWPLGMGVSIGLRIFLVIEHRNSIAGENHRHRQGYRDAEAAFGVFGFGFGAHLNLPFVWFAAV